LAGDVFDPEALLRSAGYRGRAETAANLEDEARARVAGLVLRAAGNRDSAATEGLPASVVDGGRRLRAAKPMPRQGHPRGLEITRRCGASAAPSTAAISGSPYSF
jgi:hypothetical protein